METRETLIKSDNALISISLTHDFKLRLFTFLLFVVRMLWICYNVKIM